MTKLQKRSTTSSPSVHSPAKFGSTSYRLSDGRYPHRLQLHACGGADSGQCSEAISMQAWTHSSPSSSWQVWKERNARCFRDSTASINDLLLVIKAEADRWIMAEQLT